MNIDESEIGSCARASPTPNDDPEGNFDCLLRYSSNMTKTLFKDQTWSYDEMPKVQLSRPTVSNSKLISHERTDDLKNIKANDQYGDLTVAIVRPKHPLARPVSNKVEAVAESARALIVPWMNSLDKKSMTLDEILKPDWHSPWKLYRMISGHNGWVHSLTVDPSNMWFASGCRDGLIKIWDIASGRLRLSLTGHISGVRGLAVSDRHPYLFSCADDKMVKCWDLEQNQVVRHYHGHLSGVYCLSLHPTQNILVTGGRDSVARVWDMRSKEQIHCLTGHTNTVGAILCQDSNPQLITGSYDTTIRIWDMKMGKTLTTLTNHKKSVRTLVFKHDKTAFASGASDNIKHWSLPEAKFVQNLSGHDTIINSLSANEHNVLVSGGDNGTLHFWDWRTGYNFQRLASPAQRGSIESEAGILATTFDKSGARLITGESDKSIKMFREDPNATEDTHPIDWKPDIMNRSRF